MLVQVYPDIKKVSVRVRNMNMILLAEASTLHLQSVQQWSREQGKYPLSAFNYCGFADVGLFPGLACAGGSMQIEVKMGVGSFIKDPKGRYTGGKAERLFQLAMTKYEKVRALLCFFILFLKVGILISVFFFDRRSKPRRTTSRS